MRIERALAVRQMLKARISDLYSMAVIAGLSSAELMEASIAARKSLPKTTPQWVKTYVDGYEQALRDRLYDSCLVFGGYVDGRFLSTYSWRPDYYEKAGVDPVEYSDNGRVKARGHYWRESIQWRGGTYNRGSVKPYFVEEESANG